MTTLTSSRPAPITPTDQVRANHDAWRLLQAAPGLREVCERIKQFAPLPHPVLVTGETGTGKELVARAVCFISRRAELPFVPVLVGGMSTELSDSLLFGHKRGAFTGAVEDHDGCFTAAGSGTVFLDEIGDAPPLTQVKLLRVLENGEFQPLGGSRTMRSHARVIAATNQQLLTGDFGHFRRDLYYRLEGLRIHVPPLRERREDLLVIVQELIKRLAAECEFAPPTLDAGVLELLAGEPWPGNVRQLRGVLLRCVASGSGRLRAIDVEQQLPRPTTEQEPSASPAEMLSEVMYDDLLNDRKPLAGIVWAKGRPGSLSELLPDAIGIAVRRYLSAEQARRPDSNLADQTVQVMQTKCGAPRGGEASLRRMCQKAIAAEVKRFHADGSSPSVPTPTDARR